jgi:hypothetical protein
MQIEFTYLFYGIVVDFSPWLLVCRESATVLNIAECRTKDRSRSIRFGSCLTKHFCFSFS